MKLKWGASLSSLFVLCLATYVSLPSQSALAINTLNPLSDVNAVRFDMNPLDNAHRTKQYISPGTSKSGVVFIGLGEIKPITDMRCKNNDLWLQTPYGSSNTKTSIHVPSEKTVAISEFYVLLFLGVAMTSMLGTRRFFLKNELIIKKRSAFDIYSTQ